jgi:hypothetical protein
MAQMPLSSARTPFMRNSDLCCCEMQNSAKAKSVDRTAARREMRSGDHVNADSARRPPLRLTWSKDHRRSADNAQLHRTNRNVRAKTGNVDCTDIPDEQ